MSAMHSRSQAAELSKPILNGQLSSFGAVLCVRSSHYVGKGIILHKSKLWLGVSVPAQQVLCVSKHLCSTSS